MVNSLSLLSKLNSTSERASAALNLLVSKSKREKERARESEREGERE